ncbi:hypothetical protein ABMA28_010336 [Loxostege sticticalis]|uniref:CCHC-type domain-containing protein n=1 Tax=Loxostege sticticalis TaxID=481309 RepID=A0ABD0SAI3_LOXSC
MIQLSGAKEHEAEGSDINRIRTPQAKSPMPDSYPDLTQPDCSVAVDEFIIEDSASGASTPDGSSRARTRSGLRKRVREELDKEDGSDDSVESIHAAKKPALKTHVKATRGRGRPPGTKSARLAAKDMLKTDRKKQKAQDAEAEAEVMSYNVKKALSLAKYSARERTAEELVKAVRTGTDTILHCAKRSGNIKGVFQRNFNDAAALILAAVEALAERTLNDEVRRLNEANRCLKNELEDLRKELTLKEHQQNTDPDVPSASIPMEVSGTQSSQLSEREKFEREIIAKCGVMMSARIEGLNDRLLPEKRRIPLAADRRRVETSNDANFSTLPTNNASLSQPIAPEEPQPSTSGEGGNKTVKKAVTKAVAAKAAKAASKTAPKASMKAASKPAEKAEPQKAQSVDGKPETFVSQPAKVAKAPVTKTVTASQPLTKPKKTSALTSRPGRAGRSRVRKPAPPNTPAREEPRPLPPPPKSMDEGWTTVVKRGSKKAQKGTERPQQVSAKPAKAKTAAQKLRPPRSSAIVLTLMEGAEEKGVSYRSIIQDARSRINIEEIGIASLKFAKAKTGGKLLEIPGSTSGDKADVLANKLKEILPADLVRVTRPVKTADVRISGLDDATTSDEVAAAVAKAGGCAAESVRVGEIRQTFAGSGSVVVKVPVAVAKKIGQGRLLVGWVSARIQVLENRPMRCFRCLEGGHVRAQCQTDTDRSELCYRCGRPDHKAKDCSAAPHCSVCAAHGKQADHKTGGKNCHPPKPRRKAAKPVAQRSAGQVEEMDTAK